MNYILFDDETRLNLLPFTFTRPVAEIRIGILTIREKWERYLNQPVSHLTEKILQEKFPVILADENLFVNGSVLPDKKLLHSIKLLKSGEKLLKEDVVIAANMKMDSSSTPEVPKIFESLKAVEYADPVFKINYNWDIFSKNEQALNDDFLLLTSGRKSAAISATNRVLGIENIFVEEGVKLECCMLNGTTGFIYISKNAEVMEGAMIRGPFSLGESSIVKMGTKIYGATTIGPYCRIGGEINNSVIFGQSNKAHEGYLGNSVIGEWCNLGADSNNSNLKNNYSNVKVWNYHEEKYVSTGLQFCGLMMADHSKCSINTMFNTGTIVGVSANVFGNGFPPKYIPSFSWGGSEGFTTYRIEEAIEVAQRVYERRNKKFDETEKKLMKELFDATTKYRAW